MALSTTQERASSVAISAYFLGPSIVPDGSFNAGDLQTIGYGYFSSDVGAASITIGGSSQIEAYSSTGGLQVGRSVGGSSQLEAYGSTGGLQVGRIIGGTSQLAAFSSSGGIQVGEVSTTPSGGFWFDYDDELSRRRREKIAREAETEEAKRIADELDRALAVEERRIEAEEARKAELARLNRLVAANLPTIRQFNDKIAAAADAALERQTFSTMERLERELRQFHEEELFLIEATRIIINA